MASQDAETKPRMRGFRARMDPEKVKQAQLWLRLFQTLFMFLLMCASARVVSIGGNPSKYTMGAAYGVVVSLFGLAVCLMFLFGKSNPRFYRYLPGMTDILLSLTWAIMLFALFSWMVGYGSCGHLTKNQEAPADDADSLEPPLLAGGRLSNNGADGLGAGGLGTGGLGAGGLGTGGLGAGSFGAGGLAAGGLGAGGLAAGGLGAGGLGPNGLSVLSAGNQLDASGAPGDLNSGMSGLGATGLGAGGLGSTGQVAGGVGNSMAPVGLDGGFGAGAANGLGGLGSTGLGSSQPAAAMGALGGALPTSAAGSTLGAAQPAAAMTPMPATTSSGLDAGGTASPYYGRRLLSAPLKGRSRGVCRAFNMTSTCALIGALLFSVSAALAGYDLTQGKGWVAPDGVIRAAPPLEDEEADATATVDNSEDAEVGKGGGNGKLGAKYETSSKDDSANEITPCEKQKHGPAGRIDLTVTVSSPPTSPSVGSASSAKGAGRRG